MPCSKAAGVTRREFLKTLALSLAALSLGGARQGPGRHAREAHPEPYYEPYPLSPEEREAYGALGLLRRFGEEELLANPVFPDVPLVYTKPYAEFRFRFEPPGASEDFYSRCVRCELCFYVCAEAGYNTITLMGLREGLSRLGLPVIERLDVNPCHLCMACTEVCPTGALESITEEEVRIGVALIDPDLCWGWNSGECISCVKACPYGTEVFELSYTEWGTHPRVRPERCRGCGLCIPACPVPGSAIHVLPEGVFERWRRGYKNLRVSYERYLREIRRVEREDPYRATLRAMINSKYVEDKRGAHAGG